MSFARNDAYTAAVILTIPALVVATCWCALRARRLFDRLVAGLADRPPTKRRDW